MKRLLILLTVALIGSVLWIRYFPRLEKPRTAMRPPYIRATPTPADAIAAATPAPASEAEPSASATQPPEATPEPTPVIPLPPNTSVDRILVRKSAREMTVYSRGIALRTYRVALGTSPEGPKEIQGDGRTPEGRYFIAGRNPQSDFHLSLRVSYPSPADRAHAEKLGKSPGGDIMIHGLPNGFGFIGAAHRLRDWTIGCVAVTDQEIEEIWRVVPDGCRVDIEP